MAKVQRIELTRKEVIKLRRTKSIREIAEEFGQSREEIEALLKEEVVPEGLGAKASETNSEPKAISPLKAAQLAKRDAKQSANSVPPFGLAGSSEKTQPNAGEEAQAGNAQEDTDQTKDT